MLRNALGLTAALRSLDQWGLDWLGEGKASAVRKDLAKQRAKNLEHSSFDCALGGGRRKDRPSAKKREGGEKTVRDGCDSEWGGYKSDDNESVDSDTASGSNAAKRDIWDGSLGLGRLV